MRSPLPGMGYGGESPRTTNMMTEVVLCITGRTRIQELALGELSSGFREPLCRPTKAISKNSHQQDLVTRCKSAAAGWGWSHS